MIFVGTDIVPINRIEKLIKEKGIHFLNHVFTKLEQNICDGKNSPSIKTPSVSNIANNKYPLNSQFIKLC